MLPAGEMWSVVIESPSRARTRASRMSLGGCGRSSMAEKKSGSRT